MPRAQAVRVNGPNALTGLGDDAPWLKDRQFLEDALVHPKNWNLPGYIRNVIADDKELLLRVVLRAEGEAIERAASLWWASPNLRDDKVIEHWPCLFAPPQPL